MKPKEKFSHAVIAEEMKKVISHVRIPTLSVNLVEHVPPQR